MHIAAIQRLLCCLACVTPFAGAQSGLVMYGSIDLGLAKRSGSALALERGYNNWIGISGKEALGNGMSAVVHLQARFNPDTGKLQRTGTFWQGESTAGLSGEKSGMLRLGRALTPLWNNVWRFGQLTLMAFHARARLHQGRTVRVMTPAGIYRLGKDTVRAGYGRHADRRGSKVSLGYLHALSLRTNIYTDLYRDRGRGGATGAALGIGHAF